MMKTRWGTGWAASGAVLIALALAMPVAATVAPGAVPGAVMGGGLGAALGCVTCVAAGLAAATNPGWLAALLWSQTAFAASLVCAGTCAAALTS